MGLIRKWDIENKELNDQCAEEVITRIEELDGETPGVIAAQDIIDIVTSHYGPEIYNKAIRDTKSTLEGRFDDILIDIEAMEVSA